MAPFVRFAVFEFSFVLLVVVPAFVVRMGVFEAAARPVSNPRRRVTLGELHFSQDSRTIFLPRQQAVHELLRRRKVVVILIAVARDCFLLQCSFHLHITPSNDCDESYKHVVHGGERNNRAP